MNLIISGDNPQNLAKVEALAKNLGLMVSRELAASSSGTGKCLRRGRGSRPVELIREGAPDSKNTSPSEGGPLYGIE